MSDEPLGFDSKEPEARNLSPKQLLRWMRWLGYAIERLGLGKGDVVMIALQTRSLLLSLIWASWARVVCLAVLIRLTRFPVRLHLMQHREPTNKPKMQNWCIRSRIRPLKLSSAILPCSRLS